MLKPKKSSDCAKGEPVARIAFANRLRALRKATGHYRQDFSDALGVSEAEYIAFEKAESQPTYEILLQIKKLTSCDLDYLITGKKFEGNHQHQQTLAVSSNRDGDIYYLPQRTWYWETDDQHRLVICCRPNSDYSKPPKIIGLKLWEYVGMDPEDDDHWKHLNEDFDAHRPFKDFKFRGRRNINIKWSGRPIFDSSGKFLGYCGYGIGGYIDYQSNAIGPS